MDSLVVAILVPDGPLKAWLSAALEPLPVRVFFEPWLPVDRAEFLDRLARLQVAAVLVDFDRFGDKLEGLASQIKTIRPPAPSVVAISAKVDHSLESGARAAGADDFVTPPFERTLIPLLEKLAAGHPSGGPIAHRSGKLLGAVGARGGCGTTTLACLLALALRRVTGQPVLLADLDWNAGVAGFLMNAQTPYSLLDAAASTHRLDWNYWTALVATHPSGVDVIPAPPEPVPADFINTARVRSVLRFTRSCYCWVLLDLGECWDGHCAGYLEELDGLWLITTPEPVGLYQARRALQRLPHAGIEPQRIQLLVNRASRSVLAPEDVESLVGKRPDAWVPESAELRESGRGERSLDLRGRAATRVLRLAARLVGPPGARAPAPPSLPALRIVRRVKFSRLAPRL